MKKYDDDDLIFDPEDTLFEDIICVLTKKYGKDNKLKISRKEVNNVCGGINIFADSKFENYVLQIVE